MITSEEFAARSEALWPGLYRLGVSILGQEADAQDALQEALMKAWQARERCRPDSFRPWLTRIMVNECRNIQRKRAQERPVEELPERMAEQPPDYGPLREAIDSLPETLRTPLLLHYMEGYPDKETAKALGITALAVRNRIWRARRILREVLETQEAIVYEKS